MSLFPSTVNVEFVPNVINSQFRSIPFDENDNCSRYPETCGYVRATWKYAGNVVSDVSYPPRGFVPRGFLPSEPPSDPNAT